MASNENNGKARKLAAILFADIVGFTAMMQADEKLGMSRLRHYQAVLKDEVARYNGEIIKNYGDGSICLFSSVLGAVQCANVLQEIFRSEPVVPLRIGLHLGDVMYEENDIYSNDLNIASRIESIGVPGAILMSKNVYQKIKNQSEFEFQSLGPYHFKNVTEPIEVFALANDDLAIPPMIPAEEKPKKSLLSPTAKNLLIGVLILFLGIFATIKLTSNENGKNQSLLNSKDNFHSIAVLPLANLNSIDENNEYFSIGVTQEIIDELATIKSIKVSAFTETAYYSKQDLSPEEIATELGATYLISGSSRLMDNAKRVKLSIELFNPRTKERLWYNTFDEKMDDAISIQSSIAKNVAEKLNIKLSPEEESSIEKPNTTDGQAFHLFLQAKAENFKLNPAGFQKCQILLEQALKIDPNYAQAHTLKAWNHQLSGSSWFEAYNADYAELNRLTTQHVEAAIKLNPTSSDAYLVRGSLHNFWHGKLRDAKKDIDFAIALNSWPKVPTNYCTCTMVSTYVALGKLDRAREIVDIARKADPENVMLFWDLANIHMARREFKKAQALLQVAEEIAPIPFFHFFLGWSYYHDSQYDEAIKHFTKSSEPIPLSLAYLSNAHMKLGNIKQSEGYFNQLTDRIERGESQLNLMMAIIYAAKGNIDESLSWLEKAQRENDLGLAYMANVDPIFEILYDHPRFIELRNRMQYFDNDLG